jgi:hypothetical protein
MSKKALVEPDLSDRIHRIDEGSARLYDQSFLHRRWLAEYVADVDTVTTAYQALLADRAGLRAAVAILQADRAEARGVVEAAREFFDGAADDHHFNGVLVNYGIWRDLAPLKAAVRALDVASERRQETREP